MEAWHLIVINSVRISRPILHFALFESILEEAYRHIDSLKSQGIEMTIVHVALFEWKTTTTHEQVEDASNVIIYNYLRNI